MNLVSVSNKTVFYISQHIISSDSVDHGLYKVLHSYESQLHNQKLSFMAEDIVMVINKVDKRHWRVKKIMDPSQEGVIPPSFLVCCDGHQEGTKFNMYP